MEQIIRIGMDTSKHVFQLHGVNAAEEPVLRAILPWRAVTGGFSTRNGNDASQPYRAAGPK